MMAKILLVDDEFDALSAYSLLLEFAGHEVSQAIDGDAALAALLTAPPPDIVVTDWMMPRMTGLELCERMRAERKLDGIKIVLASAAATPPDGQGKAFDVFVRKPIDLTELLGIVDRLCGPR